MKNLFSKLKKKIFLIPMALIMATGIGLGSAALAGAFSSGDGGVSPTSLTENWIDYTASFAGAGTQSNPYKIASAQNLAYLAKTTNAGNTYSGKYFEQTADIRLGGRLWTPIGSTSAVFGGIFNGNNHGIDGLYINTTESNQGLFKFCNNSIKNIILTNVNVTGSNFVGGLIGGWWTTYGSAAVENCHVKSGKIKGANYVGGIGGVLNLGTITKCSNNAEITGTEYVGGIVGESHDIITNCTNTGTIKGAQRIGGVAGSLYGVVTGCKQNGSITGESVIGGISGQNCSADVQDATKPSLVSNIVLGNITSTATNTSEIKLGGIAGTALNNINIKNCISYAIIKTSQSSLSYIGAILGSGDTTESSRILENNIFTGEINLSDVRFYGSASTNIGVNNCYINTNLKKYYSSGTFSDFVLQPDQNNDLPIQKVFVSSIYHNNTITSNWFSSRGWTKI